MIRSYIFSGVSFAALLLSIAACNSGSVATGSTSVNLAFATAQSDAAKAVKFYGIAKGVALVAELADPALQPAVTKVIAVLDPISVELQNAIAASTGDATAIEALVTQINSQAIDLEGQTASVIKVVKAS